MAQSQAMPVGRDDQGGLTGLPAALVGRCHDCGTVARKSGLRVFGEKSVCPHCYSALLATAEQTMRKVMLDVDEPDRRCGNCLAMVDPAVGSSWCPILELGDERATLCASFTPLAELGATPRPVLSPELTASALWALVCDDLQSSLGPTQIRWLQETRAVNRQPGLLQVEVAQEYTRSWLLARLMPAILQSLEVNGYPDVAVEFLVAQEPVSPPPAARTSGVLTLPLEPAPLAGPYLSSAPDEPAPTFNPAFTFQHFVIGNGNRLAHAASLAVAENAGSYNPLFLHGGVGVGKTHLLQAIGSRRASRGENVLYISSETFTNELVSAIRGGSTQDFRRRYRLIDVLLVDDVHFIVGKTSTQEEFFHTFNTLYDAGKQIVLSSDRPPAELTVLDERLRSRFSWGLQADIQGPDRDTRLEILRRKARQRNRWVPDEVLTFLASDPGYNVRELEGVLNRLLALADLHGVEPTLSLAAGIVSGGSRRELSHNHVLQAVCAYYRLGAGAIAGKQRSRNVTLPRHVAMYLLREDVRLSLPQIGDLLGGRDHSTVIYGCNRISGEMSREGPVRHDVESIRSLMFGASAG